ncbi:MAG: thioredoxin family protein [Candidatus Thorarchaeota archaeon]
MVDLNDIRSRTTSATVYIDSMDGKEGDMFRDFYDQYKLNMTVVDDLREFVKDITIVVMSAKWCGDCKFAIPVLKHLEEEIGLEVLSFANIKTAPLDPDHQWKIPPSPQEMEDWNIIAIPWIVIFSKEGKEMGTIIEKPTVKPTLEEEILHVLKG